MWNKIIIHKFECVTCVRLYSSVAEHWSRKPGVGSSILPGGSFFFFFLADGFLALLILLDCNCYGQSLTGQRFSAFCVNNKRTFTLPQLQLAVQRIYHVP